MVFKIILNDIALSFILIILIWTIFLNIITSSKPWVHNIGALSPGARKIQKLVKGSGKFYSESWNRFPTNCTSIFLPALKKLESKTSTIEWWDTDKDVRTDKDVCEKHQKI